MTPASPSPSELGARAELAVTSALLRAGAVVYLPFFNAHGRVDLVYEKSGGVFRRVQCKSAQLANDVVTFYTCSHTGGVERGYVGDVDEFGVYCEATSAVYLVPVGDVAARLTRLRLAPARNGQLRGTRWAAPYLLGTA